jgi:DUF4097 and DUF4098 domain-containing protein YvlB
MKRIPLIVCLALTCLAGNRLSAQQAPGEKEELAVPLSSPGKPYTLDVSLFSGSIEVSSYSGKEIMIDVSPGDNNRREKGDREPRRKVKEMRMDGDNGMKISVDVNTDDIKPKNPSSRDTIDGMHRINPKFSYEVTATEKDNNVTIQNSTMRNIHLALKIPQGAKLKLRTVNDGHIEVSDITGELEVSAVNGSIKLTNITGTAVANTVNGSIIANFLSVDPKAPMAFSTLNGRIDVTLPPGTKSNLKLRSDRGDVFTDFDVAIDKSTPQIEHANGSSMYSIKLGDWINGKINGGGPEIMMKNMSGNIYVRKAK